MLNYNCANVTYVISNSVVGRGARRKQPEVRVGLSRFSVIETLYGKDVSTLHLSGRVRFQTGQISFIVCRVSRILSVDKKEVL